jgi:cardiolipin synthase A/B
MFTITVSHSFAYWLPSLSQHFLIVAVALLIYVVNARARRERRAPAAAIAWVMGLVLLPYLVLPLYLMFGQRKLSAAPLQQPVAPHDESTHWADSLLTSFGLDAPAPAMVRFHAHGGEARDALWELFDSAQRSLDVCTFLIGKDVFGHEALARLAARARAGVRVRLLHDGVFALLSTPRQQLRELEAAGAEVLVFRPLFALRRVGPRNLRNHRKYAIADGAHMWAGGRNLAAEYFTGDVHKETWTDLSFDMKGPIAGAAARQFAQDWTAAQRGASAKPALASSFILEAPGTPVQFVTSGPDQAEDTAQALLVTACFRAQRRLLAISPYFVPDSSLQQALQLAARRGVQVTLVIPQRSNHQLADFARGRPLRELARSGVNVKLLPHMSHAKAVIVDDQLAISGSVNLDARSLLLNYEFAVVFYGAKEIAWLADWATEQAILSTPFDARPPGLLRDLAEGALLAVAFQI